MGPTPWLIHRARAELLSPDRSCGRGSDVRDDADRRVAGAPPRLGRISRTTARSTRPRCPTSAAWRCSSGSSPRSFTAWLLGAFDVVFDNNSEPLGVLIAAAAIFTVGFIDDIKEISAPAKVTGTVVAGVALVWFGVMMFSFRLPFYDGPIILSDDLQAAGHRAVAARHQPGDQPHRRARRARRRHRRHRRVRLLPLQPEAHRPRTARLGQPRPADGDHRGRGVRRLPAAQLQPGADLHGRRRRVAARPAARRVDERRRRPRRLVLATSSSARRTSSSRRSPSRC